MKGTTKKQALSLVLISLLCLGMTASATGLYEAEDAAFSSGSTMENVGASGGWYLDGNEGFNITWTVDAEAGNHVLAFSVKVPSGDRTMGVFVNGAQVGTVNSASTSWDDVSVQVVMISGVNTIELRDSEGSAELDVDCLVILNRAENSELTFGSNGEPATLVLNGADRFEANSSDGFYLRHFDGRNYSTTKMEHIVTSGDTITVSESGGLPRFIFRIDAYDRHLSIHLVDVEGLDGDELRAYGLYLKLYSNASIGFKDLDDVIESSGSDPVYFRWRYLWGQTLDGRRGGVALYDGALDGSALDDCLASIWAHEDLPRPAGQASWTETDVLNWVEHYRTNVVDLNEVTLEASSPAELYNLTDAIVFPNNVKRVYLHTSTWRGEYWPNYNGQTYVNTDVFPNGESDLKAYSDYLAAQGVTLRLHMVSFGIGMNDPDYIVGSVDRRLSSWGSGTLEKAVDSSETRLLFRPDAGTKPPVVGGGIAHVAADLYYNYFRIGEEIVKAERISRTDEEVWVLENCTRGFEGTDAFSHASGADAAGLYLSHSRNYVPEYDIGQPNSLMEEMVREYTRFANNLELGHMHFDGTDGVHGKYPWESREVYDFYYSQMTNPASSSRVGTSIAANFEQDFSGIRDDLTLGYFPLEIGVRTDELSDWYLATSRLDTHFQIQECILMNGRRAFLSATMSGRGVTEEIMNNHGLFDEMNDLFGDWIKLAPVLHDDDVAYVDSVMERTPGTWHYQGEEALVLSTNATGEYIWTPHHVMGRSDGSDDPFYIEQEKGTHARKQTITSGTSLTLTNPYGTKDLNVVIRVDHEGTASLTNPAIAISGGGSLSVTGTVAPGQYLEYYGGSTAQLYDNNWNLISDLPVTVSSFAVAPGVNTITVSDGGVATLDTQFIVLGNEYVLKTNDNL